MTADEQYALPPAHSRFVRHFTHAIYSDPVDEFTPFGTDEGADILAMALDGQPVLDESSTVRDVLAEEIDDVEEFIAEIPDDAPDLDGIVIGAGFTLLRLTGQVDDTGREWLVAALERSKAFYRGNDRGTFQQMLTDLASFGFS